MSIFEDIKAKGSAYRLSEEALYAEALRELESGRLRDGIWAKAMSESDMDQTKAGARYIKLRVISLRAEVTFFVDELKKAKTQSLLPPAVVSASPNSTSNKSSKIFQILAVIFLFSILVYYFSPLIYKGIKEQPPISGKMVAINLEIDPTVRCTQWQPYFTTLTNNSNITVQSLSFELNFQRRGHSDPPKIEVLHTTRILQPRESASLCLGDGMISTINSINLNSDTDIYVSNIKAFTSSQR